MKRGSAPLKAASEIPLEKVMVTLRNLLQLKFCAILFSV